MCTGRLNSGTQRQSMQSESTLAGQSACVKRLRVLAKSLPGPRGEHVRRVIASLAEFLEASAKQQNDEEERNLPSARIMINSLVKLVEQPSGSVEAILAATGLGMLVTSEPASRTTLIEVGGIRPLVELLVSAGSCVTSSSSSSSSSSWALATVAASVLGNLAICRQPDAGLACASPPESDADFSTAVRKAGGINSLVELLVVAASKVAATAAAALGNLAINNRANQDAIREAGGIVRLVELLNAGSGSDEAAMQASGALRNLAAGNSVNKEAIREAGGIKPLAACVSRSHEAMQDFPRPKAVAWALGALCNLATERASRELIVREDGVIESLFALLRSGSEIARNAARALALCLGSEAEASVLTVAASTVEFDALKAFPGLLSSLQRTAERQLEAFGARCVGGQEDISSLECLLAAASRLQVDAETLSKWRGKLAELERDLSRERSLQAQRERLGLGEFPLPADFFCPITLDRMRVPVVASDGHTYERSAIQAVLKSSGRSPMTREVLEPLLFPNRALLNRIQEYEEEVLMAARTALAATFGSTVAAEQSGCASALPATLPLSAGRVREEEEHPRSRGQLLQHNARDKVLRQQTSLKKMAADRCGGTAMAPAKRMRNA